jgi:hypothetical protein
VPDGKVLHESGPPPLLLLELTPLLRPVDPLLLPESPQADWQLSKSHLLMSCWHVVHAGESFAVHPWTHCESPTLHAQ